MEKLIILLLFVLTYCAKNSESCDFSSYSKTYENMPTFFRKFGELHMLFPANHDSIYIPNNEYITAFCPNYYQSQYIGTNFYGTLQRVHVKCKDNSIEYETEETPEKVDRWRNDPTILNCLQSNIKMYENPVVECTKKSFMFAQFIEGVPIVFANTCYDQETMDIDFVHYVMADRSAILENQWQYNPSWTLFINNSKADIVLYNLRDPIHNEQLKSSLGHLSELVSYESHSIIPSDIFSPYFPEPNFGSWANIYWWTPLLKGNWKIFENILKAKSMEVSLDIFAGSSGTVTYPPVGRYGFIERLKFYTISKQKPVPLYVWNYVKPRRMENTNDTTGVVVIGINSPFFDGAACNYTPLCDDICDSTGWLQPLNRTRRISAFGYIFCCNPDDVKNLLDGFPQETSNIFPPTIATTEEPNTGFRDTNIYETSTDPDLVASGDGSLMLSI